MVFLTYIPHLIQNIVDERPISVLRTHLVRVNKILWATLYQNLFMKRNFQPKCQSVFGNCAGAYILTWLVCSVLNCLCLGMRINQVSSHKHYPSQGE